MLIAYSLVPNVKAYLYASIYCFALAGLFAFPGRQIKLWMWAIRTLSSMIYVGWVCFAGSYFIYVILLSSQLHKRQQWNSQCCF